jgi:hypothetical protein
VALGVACAAPPPPAARDPVQPTHESVQPAPIPALPIASAQPAPLADAGANPDAGKVFVVVQKIDGNVDRGAIHAAISARQTAIEQCTRPPSLSGVVEMNLLVAGDGHLIGGGTHRTTLERGPLLDCVVAAINSAKLPRGESRQVEIHVAVGLGTRVPLQRPKPVKEDF